jgi:hypothetical protein
LSANDNARQACCGLQDTRSVAAQTAEAPAGAACGSPGAPSCTATICSRRGTAAPLSASTAAARCSLRPGGAAGTAGMPEASNCSDRARLVDMPPAAGAGEATNRLNIHKNMARLSIDRA